MKNTSRFKRIPRGSGKCNTKYCRKPKAKNNNFCWSCIKKKYKAKHPLRYCYLVLRSNARRRGKKFTITMKQFVRWAKKVNYKPVGEKPSYPDFKSRPSVDRKIDELGYQDGNLQLLTVSDNSKKRHGVPF